MNAPKLMVKSPTGRYIVATKTDILQAHAHLLAMAELPKQYSLESPHAVRSFLVNAYGLYDYEIFGMIMLDNRHRLIRVAELFRGTIDGASVHPREVVKTALDNNAAAVVLFHNHPSGIVDPSQADELITMRLKDALNMVDIRVLDHIIVTNKVCASFAERGLSSWAMAHGD